MNREDTPGQTKICWLHNMIQKAHIHVSVPQKTLIGICAPKNFNWYGLKTGYESNQLLILFETVRGHLR